MVEILEPKIKKTQIFRERFFPKCWVLKSMMFSENLGASPVERAFREASGLGFELLDAVRNPAIYLKKTLGMYKTI